MKQTILRFASVLMAVAMLLTALPAALSEENPGSVQRIDLNIDAITIGVGQSVKTIKPVAYPQGSSAKFTWKSDNTDVATVNSSGKIKGIKKGTANITISADNGVSAKVKVTVAAKGKGVTKITLNKKSATVTRGNSITLKATLTPKKPKDKNIIWTSSDESVATVNSKGKVTAKAVGAATISAISSSGITATCKIKVEGVKVKKIALSGKSSMLRNETQQLKAKISPNDADNQALKWTTSDKKIATVDKDGVVTALKKGTVTITATAKDGSKVKGTFKITVKKGLAPTPTPTPIPTPKPTATPTPRPTPTPTPAPTTFTDDKGIKYSLNEGTATVIGYEGTIADLIIPGRIEGHVVKSIGDKAFTDCIVLTSVKIPDSVSSIGAWAFSECTSLTSITIPDGVTSIGEFTFYYCTSLTSITIPGSVSSIGKGAFNWCISLTSITIQDGVISIGDGAFYACSSLTSITIPNSVTSIGGGAFGYCISLTTISIPNGVSSIQDSTFGACTKLTSITIPGSVSSIGENAFYNCSSLTTISIPNSVTSIGNSAFRWCNSLTSITIPDGVTSIGDEAFYSCESLTSATIPASVTSIGTDAFAECSDELVIYGKTGSAAEAYASANGIKFVAQ